MSARINSSGHRQLSSRKSSPAPWPAHRHRLPHGCVWLQVGCGACKTFNVWGVSDRYSWIMSYMRHWDEPLLFDADFQPKPAYQAVLDGFRSS
ncbi:MAG TPA: endo-1,4-beta-xylanase [Ktedonobacterales bacterium]